LPCRRSPWANWFRRRRLRIDQIDQTVARGRLTGAATPALRAVPRMRDCRFASTLRCRPSGFPAVAGKAMSLRSVRSARFSALNAQTETRSRPGCYFRQGRLSALNAQGATSSPGSCYFRERGWSPAGEHRSTEIGTANGPRRNGGVSRRGEPVFETVNGCRLWGIRVESLALFVLKSWIGLYLTFASVSREKEVHFENAERFLQAARIEGVASRIWSARAITGDTLCRCRHPPVQNGNERRNAPEAHALRANAGERLAMSLRSIRCALASPLAESDPYRNEGQR
jgi:hypothetical protein